MHVAVILNENAGALLAANSGSPPLPQELEERFRRVGITADIHVGPPNEVAGQVRQCLGRGDTNAIVVGGGDGTLSSAAAVLAGTDMPLGILPLGTLNHFAKDLGLIEDVPKCVEVIAQRRVAAVDLAEVNGRVFINNCSIGAYPAAVQRRDELRRRRGWGKQWAMLHATLDQLRNLRRLHVEIDVDGATLRRRSPFVLVSNNRYSGQIFARQLRARLDEGVLCTYTTREHRVAPLLRLFLRSIFNRIDAAGGLESHAAPQVMISLTEHAPTVATDGEVTRLTAPLHFRLRPRALRVLVPRR